MEPTSTAASVRDLVRKRLGQDSDTWNLALVQRAEVWDQVRMRHLLDSLLAGYPIGSILLCRVNAPSQTIRTEGGQRVVQEATSADWQLLDGQQRINALISLLSRHGRYGRFFLHMTRERQAAGPTHRRRATDTALRHIAWSEDEDEEIPQREAHVDLSRWADWADSTLAQRARVPPNEVARVLADLDPAFTANLTGMNAETAAHRLNALREAWFRPSIPVLRAEVETPLDVLEIFTRINLGGVDVVSNDVYFAAIKTFWTDAEASLARFDEATPFLRRRFGSLRFVSRLASRGLGFGDPLPLDAERLSGPLGEQLRLAMHELTAVGSRTSTRVRAFSEWMTRHSALGFVLYLVTAELWDEVLAWAVVTPRDDDDWYRRNLPLIDAYLLGATLFRYRQVLGDRFQRIAFLEALTAGADGSPFPLERILRVTRVGDGLRRRRQAIRGLDEHREPIARDNARVLTCLAQRVEYQSDDLIDWDHIFPAAQAKRMWRPGQGRRRHHPDRHLVNGAGNLWALLASTNRSLQDLPPSVKFRRLHDWEGDRSRVWSRDRWSLTDQEIAAFIEVDTLLDDDPQHIDQAMELFAQLVRGRTARLLDGALEQFPEVRLFASDTELDPEGPSPSRGFRGELGLPALPSAHAAAGGAATAWTGRHAELDDALKKAIRDLPSQQERNLPYRAGIGDMDRAAYVAVPVEARNPEYVIVGRCMARLSTSTTPVWMRMEQSRREFDTYLGRLRESTYADRVRFEATEGASARPNAWIPIEVPDGIGGEALAAELNRAISDILAVLSGDQAE